MAASETEPCFKSSLSLSFSLEIISRNETAPSQSQPKMHQSDTDERSLSPRTRKLQQDIRDRARGRVTDAQSLHILDAATATIAERTRVDKIKDRKSLALLESHTRVDQGQEDSGMLTSPSWPPTLDRVKGENGKPLSYFPSSSTWTDAQSWDVLPLPTTDTKGPPELDSSSSRTDRRKNKSPLAESRGSPQPKNVSTGSMLGEDGKEKVDEVLSLIDSVKQRDGQESAELRRGLAEAMETLMQSPTSSIKHLAADYKSMFDADVRSDEGLEDVAGGNPWVSGLPGPSDEGDSRDLPCTDAEGGAVSDGAEVAGSGGQVVSGDSEGDGEGEEDSDWEVIW